VWSGLRHLVVPHSHDAADRVDPAMEASSDGMRALWISLAVLGATAVFQAFVAVASGSVALLSDTLHNVADALTAVPVGIAFLLGRRPADLAPHKRCGGHTGVRTPVWARQRMCGPYEPGGTMVRSWPLPASSCSATVRRSGRATVDTPAVPTSR
jgi:hypothetical protein